MLCACNKSNKLNNSPEYDNNLVKDTCYGEKTTYSFHKINTPINVLDIKSKFSKYSTSTFLNSNECLFYFKPDYEGYYGQYNLIGEKNWQLSQIAILTVYNHEKPWLYNNRTDIFIEILMNSPDYYVFDSIHIGLSSKEVLRFLGKPKMEKENLMIYTDTVDMIAIFSINSDTISFIKAGRYKKEIFDNLESNIINLIKN